MTNSRVFVHVLALFKVDPRTRYSTARSRQHGKGDMVRDANLNRGQADELSSFRIDYR